MPKVSIILPIYKAAQYLPKCLESLLNQTLNDIEIICVNDESPDNSLDILHQYAAQDKRIKIINQKNTGPGVARNNGIKVAGGKYVAFVDPDDWVELDMYENMYNTAEKEGADIVECGLITHEENSDKLIKRTNLFTIDGQVITNIDISRYPQFVFGGVSAGWNKLCRRSLLNENNICFSAGRCAEDMMFTIGGRVYANKVIYLNKPLYHYLHRKSSLTHNKSATNLEVPQFLADVWTLLQKQNLADKLENEFIKFSSQIASIHYRKVPNEKCQEYRNLCRQLLPEEAWLKIDSYTKISSFWHKLFSINFNGKKWEVYLLGIKMKFKPKLIKPKKI